MTADVYLLTSEVAERLRLPERTVRRLAHAHKIGFLVSPRSGYRFTEDDIAALVDKLREQQAS